ncbi:Protein CBG09902 [Caenorhabditis briggsae]|uniref:Serine/threonine-protein phosphatase n=3 Tax=Caenorhabditis TaxID=6237 RepID=A8X9X7_CAEBR|nr:Protein CBG09902 [Caenorhabditis briggsae]ULU01722.1 hypothetical protein L3Y34_001781 [Caenorhabditis briggsae]CAP29442.3 Protein CBG09902 [Caenorhabditis briggsae]
MANTRSTYGNVNNKSDFNVDEIIVKILNIGSIGTNFEAIISTKHLFSLLDVVKDVFMKQGVMLELEAPVKICGDVHGQYSDVLRLFDRGGFPPLVNYLFLGDYVDRGPQSLEVVCLFLAYKVKFPGNFFMLRGNHECGSINRVYGFLDEVCRKYGPKVGAGLWNTFQYTFSCMPMTALVSGKILCMHGGISCKMKNLNQLRKIARPQLEVPNPSMEIDILWSDPDTTIDGFDDSTRGVGQVFGEAALKSVMSNLGVELVARAHQVVQDGYEFFCKKRLVTIFSAPHYCGEFDNAAAMMNVDKNLTCSFQIMRPVRKDVSKKDENN